MADVFLNEKRKNFIENISKAFPSKYRRDVLYVCNSLSFDCVAIDGRFCSTESTEWILKSHERIKIPYRIYLNDSLSNYTKEFNEIQEIILHCIFSRSYDGYVREKHIGYLLESSLPEWVLPYIIKVCDEYVIQILETVYDVLKERDCAKLREICRLNLDYFKLGYCRMISYWNEYYRGDCYFYKNYIGKKLYDECFGYRKNGQRTINL